MPLIVNSSILYCITITGGIMATIQKRRGVNGKETYTVTIRLKGVHSQTATFDRLTDAKRWSASTESSIREGRYLHAVEAKRNTLADVINRYLKDPTVKQITRDGYRPFLLWWREEAGYLKLHDLTPAKISLLRDKLQDTPVQAKKQGGQIKVRTAATCNRNLAALSSILSIAWREWQLIEENPCKKVRKLQEPRGRTRFLSEEERERLLLACKDSESRHLYLAVLLALATGARKKEVWDLSWNDVDLINGMVTFNQTKNDEIRSIPLAKGALEMLRDHSKIRRIDTTKVFPSKSNPKQSILLERPWRTALKNAQIEDFRWHDLRHSAASYLAMSGVSLLSIAEILGHKTLQMVKRYSHLSQDHLRDEINKMANNYKM